MDRKVDRAESRTVNGAESRQGSRVENRIGGRTVNGAESRTGNRPGKPDRGLRAWRRWIGPAACVAVSLLLWGGLTLASGEGGNRLAEARLPRDGYGGDRQDYRLLVEGLESETVALTVPVEPRIYTKEEAEALFDSLMETMESRIRGENPSLSEVRSDLRLPGYLEEEGVRVRWLSSQPEILDAFGEVREEAITDRQEVILTAELSAGEYRQTYELPVQVLPPERSPSEKRREALSRQLKQMDESQRERPELILPERFEGRELRYYEEKDSRGRTILLLGGLAAVLLLLRGQSEERQKNQRRERELLLDYADLLSKIMVLTGAGLATRNAWERIVWDYERARKLRGGKKRAAYEEMRRTVSQIQNGMPEGAAYREFGRRCRLQPYLKLSGLLEQNQRSGMKQLREILRAEMNDALEQRRNLARRLGEEAGTKLLLPLFLMLGIVMVMIMVPAMMVMG